MTEKVLIRRRPTGVPGLDDVLGGGLPEFSFNLIAGAPRQRIADEVRRRSARRAFLPSQVPSGRRCQVCARSNITVWACRFVVAVLPANVHDRA